MNLGVKQTYGNAEGLVSSTLNRAVVTLPEGMTVNPSAGAGLAACSLAEYEEEGVVEGAGGCPNESKLGSVEISTPALAEKATGSVYLAQPYANLAQFAEPGHPGGSLLALYVVASFPVDGVLVKVAGKVEANPVTGRLVTVFERQPALGGLPGLGGLPPVPFTTFTFKFPSGSHRSPGQPPGVRLLCGERGVEPVVRTGGSAGPQLHPFPITQGVEGGPCPTGGVPPLHPQVSAGTEDNDAGSYGPLDIRITRNDGEQEITGFSSQLPPGLTGNLSGVPFCSQADIEAARDEDRRAGGNGTVVSCTARKSGTRSLVLASGSVLAVAPGKIYMAGPFEGAPFSVVVDHLARRSVRSTSAPSWCTSPLDINPTTAAGRASPQARPTRSRTSSTGS